MKQHRPVGPLPFFVIAQLGLRPFSLSPSWVFAPFCYRPVGRLPKQKRVPVHKQIKIKTYGAF